MCRLDLLIRGSIGFVVKCVSVPQDNRYHQITVINNFMWQLTFAIPVSNCTCISTGCSIKTKDWVQTPLKTAPQIPSSGTHDSTTIPVPHICILLIIICYKI